MIGKYLQDLYQRTFSTLVDIFTELRPEERPPAIDEEVETHREKIRHLQGRLERIPDKPIEPIDNTPNESDEGVARE